MLKNVVRLPGETRRRSGFVKDHQQPRMTSLWHFAMSQKEALFAGGLITNAAASPAMYRDGDGEWNTIPGIYNIDGACVHASDGSVYGCGSYLLEFDRAGYCFRYDGSTFAMDPFGGTKIVGGVMESAIGRIFVANPMILHEPVVRGYAYELSSWTKSNATVSTSSNWRTVTFSLASGFVESASAVTQIEDGWVTAQQHLRPSYTAEVPLTIEIYNTATSAVIGKREILLSARGHDTDVARYGFSVFIASGTTWKFRVKASTASLTCPSNATVDIGWTADEVAVNKRAYGTEVNHGRYFFEESAVAQDDVVDTFPGRIIWCEADNVEWWRAENYTLTAEAPGPVTAMAVVGKRLVVMKERGAWVFALTSDPDLPLQFVDYVPEIGCVGASVVAFGEVWFVDRDNVYRWNLAEAPSSIVPPELQRYLFKPNNAATRPTIAVDTDLRMLIVGARRGSVHVVSLDLSDWTEWEVRNADGEVLSLDAVRYARPSGEAVRELWAVALDVPFEDTTQGVVCVLREGTPTDNFDGTADYGSEVWLNTIQSPTPRRHITLEKVVVAHGCTESADLHLDVSRDNGATWATASASLTGLHYASGDDAAWFPIHTRQSGARLTVRLRCDQGSEAAFVLYSVEAHVLLWGPALDRRANG